MTEHFEVINRDIGHWDIVTNEGMIKIRGRAGSYMVQDEINRPYPVIQGFATVDAAMLYICSRLMKEE